jgi:hypothetical protein
MQEGWATTSSSLSWTPPRRKTSRSSGAAADLVRDECEALRVQFLEERNAFVGRNQALLLEALADDLARDAASA